MKIYVASSWRNETQPAVVEFLRAHGHEVYDFRHPIEGNDGFSWKQVGLERDKLGKSTLEQLKAAHAHPTAEQGFKFDFDAMKWADACVLVLPCGNSAHLEAGWMQGQGKLTLVYCDSTSKIEPELMYKFLGGGLYDSLDAIHTALITCRKCGGCGYVSVPGELLDATCGQCGGYGSADGYPPL